MRATASPPASPASPSASAWDYARWWTASLISGLSVLLRLPTADPGPEPAYVFRGPLEAAADAAASGEAGELLAALALVAASILVLGLISWGRSWARLHDGTFAGDRAPTRTHGDAWLESRPSRVARRCPVWDGREAAKGVIVAGSVGDGLATVPAVHSLIRAGSNAGKTRRALAPSIAAAIDRNAHGIPTSVIVHDPKSEIRAWTEPLARRAGMEVVAIRLDEPSSRRGSTLSTAPSRHSGPRASQALWPSSASCRPPSCRRLLLGPEVLHGRQPQPADRPLPARDSGRADPRRRAEPLDRACAPGAP